VVLVLGDDDARQQLLGTTRSWSEWEPLMDSEHVHGGAIWLPAGSLCEELRRCAGTQFDADVVDAFLAALRDAGEPGLGQLRDAA
jgi:hypothetical protein